MSAAQSSPEQVFVVSPSQCLGRRIQRALAPAGFVVERATGAPELARHRRQRPFLLCFVDSRGAAGGELVGECLRARPTERLVVLLDPWQGADEIDAADRSQVFGFLREPFTDGEVLIWIQRASDERRLLQGDRSLEDLLYARFRAFLQDLGPQGMTSLHDLVWERVERPLLTAVLQWTGGNQSRAAEILGIHRNTLRAKIRSLRIDPGKPLERTD